MPKSHWLDYVKEAAVDAVGATKPSDYMVGTVVSTKPLKIRTSEGDGTEIEEAFLHLTRNVTDFEMNVSISDGYGWKTMDKGGGSGYAAFESHNHDIMISKNKMMIHNALKKGDKVLLLRKSGGQDFIVIDRVVS